MIITTEPDSAIQNAKIGFQVSIKEIAEYDRGNKKLRSVLVSQLTFHLDTVTEGNNKKHNYTAHLPNGASLSVFVSFLILFLV